MKKLVVLSLVVFLFFCAKVNAQVVNFSLTEGTYYPVSELLLSKVSDNWNGSTIMIESSKPLSFIIRVDNWYYGTVSTPFFGGYTLFEMPNVEGEMSISISKSQYLQDWDNDVIKISTVRQNVVTELSVHKVINGINNIISSNIPMSKNDIYLFPNQSFMHWIDINLSNMNLTNFNVTGISVRLSFYMSELPNSLSDDRMDELEDLFDDIEDDLQDQYGNDFSFTYLQNRVDENYAELEISCSADQFISMNSFPSLNLYLNFMENIIVNSSVEISTEFRLYNSLDMTTEDLYFSWQYNMLPNSGIIGDVNGDMIVNTTDIVLLSKGVHWTSADYYELRQSIYNGPGKTNISRAAGMFGYYVTKVDMDALNIHLNGGNEFSNLWMFGQEISGQNSNFVEMQSPEFSVSGQSLVFNNSSDFSLIKGSFADGSDWYQIINSSGMQSVAIPEGVVIQDVLSKNINSTTAVTKDETIPTKFSVSQNYPNPFNPTTTINFAIPKSENVTLKVFNTLGQEVAELISSQMEAGNHSVLFDASNLASGTYIYRLSAGSFVQTKKMILIK